MTPPAAAPGWPGAAATKFRPPQLRADALARPRLLAWARDSAHRHRVTLVCAAAGAGKSTLLTQLHAACDGLPRVWLALDEDDDDANRLFASLLAALEPLQLEWSVDPRALASQLTDAGPVSRSAVAVIVNALCSFDGDRLLLVLDDLHHLTDPAALQLLEHLIERLPPEVGVVIGTRTEPRLALARWRSRAELGELRDMQLRFEPGEAQALARARGADAGTAEHAWARTHGWAAGLRLMLDAASRPRGTTEAEAPVDDRHLFDFLASEVLAAQPAELQAFALACGVLSELTPALAAAVTGRHDAPALLDTLQRRNLFVSVLDAHGPVLRFHDLFRDFLQLELERREPGRSAELHARAAAVDPVLVRAVGHWLRAGRWHEALAALRNGAVALLAEGARARIEQWLDRLPPAVQAEHADAHLLRGLCAWFGWDWQAARRHLAHAFEAYRVSGDTTGRDHAFAWLGWAANATGDLAESARLRAAAATLTPPPAPPQRAMLDALAAWHALAEGDAPAAGRALQALADAAMATPGLLFPSITTMSHGYFVGLAETCAPLASLQRSAGVECRRPGAHWELGVLAQHPWLPLWRGDAAGAEATLAALSALAERLPGDPGLRLNALHVRALLACARGRPAVAAAAAAELAAVFDAPEREGSAATWRRVYLLVRARVHWAAQDAAALRALWPQLAPPRDAQEWPALDTGRALVRGWLALLDGEHATAAAALDEAVARHTQHRLPTFVADPRPARAMLHAAGGDLRAALAALRPVLDEAGATQQVGPLLLEPAGRLHPLLQAAADPADPAGLGTPWPDAATWLQRLAGWQPGPAPARPARPQGLSPQEWRVLERLADGDSNKLIARAFDLSPHTVKRHVANILDKLGVDSRGRAAAWWRQHAGG